MKLCWAMLAALCWPAMAAVNIEGPWVITTPHGALKPADGSALPFTADGLAAYKKNQADLIKLDPVRRCLPPGVPRLMLQDYPFNIVQGKSMYGVMYEWNHLNQVVYLRPDHTETIGPLYMGESVGHWDGDSFVIDANSFNPVDWLDDTGIPISYDLHVVERLSLSADGKRLENRLTIDDKSIFTHPWTAVITFRKDPGRIIREDYCLGRMGLGAIAVKGASSNAP